MRKIKKKMLMKGENKFMRGLRKNNERFFNERKQV